MNDLHFWSDEFSKPKTMTTFTIKKFNKLGQLCYQKSIKEAVSTDVIKLFEDAGFTTEITTEVYYGLYDPTRTANIIELYQTDEEIYRRENMFKEKKKWYQL